MTREQPSADILLRFSLVEGFNVRHLFRLGEHRDRLSSFADGISRRGDSLLHQGIEAATSREAGEKAEEVREACARIGARIATLGSEDYPALLSSIPDAPLVLYWRGSLPTGGKLVAIVGSRAPTDSGK